MTSYTSLFTKNGSKGTLNLRKWTMREFTIIRHHVAGTDFAGVDKSARCGTGGHCKSGQCIQEWSNACENVIKTS